MGTKLLPSKKTRPRGQTSQTLTEEQLEAEWLRAAQAYVDAIERSLRELEGLLGPARH